MEMTVYNFSYDKSLICEEKFLISISTRRLEIILDDNIFDVQM